jgi:hypothetical protein
VVMIYRTKSKLEKKIKADDVSIRIKYLKEERRFNGIRINYNEKHYVYALSEGVDTKVGSALILFDKCSSDEAGIESSIPFNGIEFL